MQWSFSPLLCTGYDHFAFWPMQTPLITLCGLSIAITSFALALSYPCLPIALLILYYLAGSASFFSFHIHAYFLRINPPIFQTRMSSQLYLTPLGMAAIFSPSVFSLLLFSCGSLVSKLSRKKQGEKPALFFTAAPLSLPLVYDTSPSHACFP